jgi:2-oxo-4-hydroxy-4-carboxy-5-ureidoimidazoline decarboxylase
MRGRHDGTEAQSHMPIDMKSLNALDRAEFVALVGGVFENSPWVAEAVWRKRPFVSLGALHSAMIDHVRALPPATHVALLRAHPELAGRGARLGAMTRDSVTEQAAAGLDRLGDAEAERFDALNRAYRDKFGFPFIIAARDHSRASILAEFEKRLANDIESEIAKALEQVFRITWLRLERAFGAAARTS